MRSLLQMILFGYIFIINVVTFLVYGFDKASARVSGARRTPEKILWLLAFIGGSVGALVAMHAFRHKTKKLSFQFVLVGIVAAQAVLLFIAARQFGIELALGDLGNFVIQ